MAWNTKFPPAEWFADFDQYLGAGTAQKILDSYLSETEHRRLLERRKQTFPLIVDIVGRSFALIVALGVLGCAVAAMHFQAYKIAAMFGGGVLVAVINAFLRRGRNR